MSTIVDFRDIPNYSVSEAAGYLRLSEDTLRAWVYGRLCPSEEGKRFFEPLIKIPNPKTKQLSFINLVEAHVLSAILQVQRIRLDQLRIALDSINHHFPTPHPLSRIEFETKGLYLFVETLGHLLVASNQKQLAMQKILKTFLTRIERDDAGLALRLFPFTRLPALDAPKTVVIDPRISFGRPVLAGTGIPTAILAERYKAGESIDDLADDYDCSRLQIEEGIRGQLLVAV